MEFSRPLVLSLFLAATAVASPKTASVQVGGCSGTVIQVSGRTAWIMSAAHCIARQVESPRVVSPLGWSSSGVLRHSDPRLDLALYSTTLPEGAAQDAVSIPGSMPKGTPVAWGYPGGKGPTQATLVPTGRQEFSNIPIAKSTYDVSKGRFRNGSSGGGVFVGESLVGVQTHGKDDKEVYATSLADIRAFSFASKARCGVNLIPGSSDLSSPLESDSDRTAAIAEIRRLLKGLQAKPGPPGPQGAPGPPGIDGKDGPDYGDRIEQLERRVQTLERRVVELETWRANFRATFRLRVTPRSKE